MTSSYTAAIETVRDALQIAGMRVFKVVPEKGGGPMVFVSPDDPYITREGATFGGEILRMQVTVLVAPGVNERMADELNAQIEAVRDVLYELDDYEVGVTLQPGPVPVNGQTHLGVAIEISTEIHR